VVGFFSGMRYERSSKVKKQNFSQKSGPDSELYQAGRDQNIKK